MSPCFWFDNRLTKRLRPEKRIECQPLAFMKVLVTGGAGFIGRWLLELLPDDTDVVVVDCLDPQVHGRAVAGGWNREASPALARATFVKADVRDARSYARAAQGTDVVVHLAAQTGTGQSMYEVSRYVDHNVGGTARLLDLVATLTPPVRRIVLASSRAVYGEGSFGQVSNPVAPDGRRLSDLRAGFWGIRDRTGLELTALPMREDQATKPTSVYGLTKLWQEQLVERFARSAGLDYLILRLQNVYGPGQALGNPYAGVVGAFVDAVARHRAVELFEDGKMTRDFVYVHDVARALAGAVLHPGSLGLILNCGSGISITLQDLLAEIALVVGDAPGVKCSGRFRIGDVRHAVADMQRYREVFGSWAPTALRTGLQRYFTWYLSQPHVTNGLLQTSLSALERKGLLGRAGAAPALTGSRS
jgi:dTDP-L-rhamnose 4-epimerase